MEESLTPLQRFFLAFIAFFAVLFNRQFAEEVHRVRARQKALPLGGAGENPPLSPGRGEGGVAAPSPAAGKGRGATPPPAAGKGVAAAPPAAAGKGVEAAPPAAGKGVTGAAPTATGVVVPPPIIGMKGEVSKPEKPPQTAPPPVPKAPDHSGTLHVLALLQRDGRLLDFLEESSRASRTPNRRRGPRRSRRVQEGARRAPDARARLPGAEGAQRHGPGRVRSGDGAAHRQRGRRASLQGQPPPPWLARRSTSRLPSVRPAHDPRPRAGRGRSCERAAPTPSASTSAPPTRALAYLRARRGGARRRASSPSRSSCAPARSRPRPLLPSFLYLPHAAELPAGAIGAALGRERPSATWSASSRARAARDARPARLVAPRAGSRTPASTAARPSCRPGARRTSTKISPRRGLRALPRAPARGLGRRRREGRSRRSRSTSRKWCSPCRPRSTPSARELTVEAARAGRACATLTLLEEPQAALYAWVAATGDALAQAGQAGRRSSSSSTSAAAPPTSRLIAVVERDGDSASSASRSATTSSSAATTWTSRSPTRSSRSSPADGKKLDRWQLLALTHACAAGEGARSSATARTRRAGHGARRAARALIGGALRIELTRGELDRDARRRLLPARSRRRAPPRSQRAQRPHAARPPLRVRSRRSRATWPRSSPATARCSARRAPPGRGWPARPSCTRPPSSSTAAS